MPHPFDILALNEGTGALIFTPCPGTKETSIDDALATLCQAGAAALITLMTKEELIQHKADGLAVLCATHGLQWFHCPIEDDRAPKDDFTKAWLHAGPAVHQLLTEGKTIAIHCKGGSGRTGLMAAQIMLERGNNKAFVKNAIQALRPKALTLPPHVDYFDMLAERS